MAWHRQWWAGPALRAIGVALLGVAALAGRRLFGHAGIAPAAVDYPLALAAFACASAGSALLTLGAHLFDRVELSARWARRL